MLSVKLKESRVLITNMIKRWLIKLLQEAMRVEFTNFRYELTHSMLADIGVEDFEKLIQQGKDNRKTIGHTDYSNLTEMYLQIMRERKSQ